MATRCCSPPESCAGYLRVFGGETDTVEQLHRALACLGSRDAFHTYRRLRDVLERGHVREQIEVLEHHADTLAHPGHVAFW